MSAAAGFLDVERISVEYGRVPVLNDVSLSVSEGELVALLGSSGCGKTTLLRTIAGFARASAGAIRVAGRNITGLPPDRRDMALVFQSYALWPHMSVRDNIGYGLKLRRVKMPAIRAKVDEILSMLGLDGLGDRNVTALSGGQRQRVALGRALAVDPRILLLDEPLSNLDARIRQSVRHEIRALQRRLGITAIHVTHDREEAMVMADRIVILNGGRVEQEGPPEQIYNAPATPFVARFMGAENAVDLDAHLGEDLLEVIGGAYNAAARLRRPPTIAQLEQDTSGRVSVAALFRSEAASLSEAEPDTRTAGTEQDIVLIGTVAHVSYPGGTWRHTVRVGSREVQVDAAFRIAPPAPVHVRLPSDAVFLFSRNDDTGSSSENPRTSPGGGSDEPDPAARIS